jgi:hypothetical protein
MPEHLPEASAARRLAQAVPRVVDRLKPFSRRVYQLLVRRCPSPTLPYLPSRLADVYASPVHNHVLQASLQPDTAVDHVRDVFQSYNVPPDVAPRDLVILDVRLSLVLDLTDPAIEQAVGVTGADLVQEPRWAESLDEALGQALSAAGLTSSEGPEAVLVPAPACPVATDLVLFMLRARADSSLREWSRSPYRLAPLGQAGSEE